MLEKLPVSGVRKLFAFLTNAMPKLNSTPFACKTATANGRPTAPSSSGCSCFFAIFYTGCPSLRDWPFHRVWPRLYYAAIPAAARGRPVVGNPGKSSRRVRWHRKPVAAGTWTGGFFCEAGRTLRREGVCQHPGAVRRPTDAPFGDLRPDQPGAGDNAIVAGRTAAGRSKRHPQPVYRAATGYCGVPRCGAAPGVDSSYPSCFFERRVKQLGLHPDTLSVSCESGMKKREAARALPLLKFGIVSADFAGFVKPLTHSGGRPIYYRSPSVLMHETKQPPLSAPFREVYEAVCGAALLPAGGGRRFPMNWAICAPGRCCTPP